jgi:hypothetical protein
MRGRGIISLAVLLLAGLCWVQSPQAKAGNNLVVVAGDDNFDDASPWVNFLAEKGITIVHVLPEDFQKAKQEKYIVILGGPRDADEIGAVILKEILNPEELRSVEAEGPRMIVKSDVWSKGQEVIVFAGKSQQEVTQARKSNRAAWWPKIAGWFGIAETVKTGEY